MIDPELERTQLVPRGLDETFAFFADPRNLEAITPPWLHFRILEAPDRLERGSFLRYDNIRYRVPGGPLAPTRLARRLVEEIFDYRAERLRELL